MRKPAGPAAELSATPDTEVARRSVYLHAGQIVFSTEPAAVTTIVGSCVCICLFDPVTRAGGMNHYLLPLPATGQPTPRFGSVANQMLLQKFINAGVPPTRLRARVFGGASVLGPSTPGDLGLRNVDLADEFLSAQWIALVSKDVGGRKGRKVIFHTDDGSAWVREL